MKSKDDCAEIETAPWQSFEMIEKGPCTATIDLFDVLSLPVVDSIFYRFPNRLPGLLKGAYISKNEKRRKEKS